MSDDERSRSRDRERGRDRDRGGDRGGDRGSDRGGDRRVSVPRCHAYLFDPAAYHIGVCARVQPPPRGGGGGGGRNEEAKLFVGGLSFDSKQDDVRRTAATASRTWTQFWDSSARGAPRGL